MEDWGYRHRAVSLGAACHEAASFVSIILTNRRGGFDVSLAKTAAYFPVQRICSLDNRRVGRTSDTRARRPARFHLKLGRSALPAGAFTCIRCESAKSDTRLVNRKKPQALRTAARRVRKVIV